MSLVRLTGLVWEHVMCSLQNYNFSIPSQGLVYNYEHSSDQILNFRPLGSFNNLYGRNFQGAFYEIFILILEPLN